MHQAYPHLAWASWLLAGAVTGLVVLAGVRRRRALRRLAASPAPGFLHVSRARQQLRSGLLLAAAALLAITILGPQWGEVDAGPAETTFQGRDVLIVLDVSRSMLAEDVSPNRLERAKADIRDLVSSLERRGGFRVGLAAFADRASLVCPFTSDYRCFHEELTRASLHTLRLRGDVSDEGTQIGTALARAAAAIDDEAAPYTDVILFSDGGDMEEETLAVAEALAHKGVAVHAVGLGNPATGALIPLARPDGSRTYLSHRGETVRTRLEEEVLRQIAGRTGGEDLGVATGFVPLEGWFEDVVAAKALRELQTSGRGPTWIHRFQLFLAPAVGLLILHLLIRDSARAATPRPSRARYFPWARRRKMVDAPGGNRLP
jgi:Ca-activated chloride channel family protein